MIRDNDDGTVAEFAIPERVEIDGLDLLESLVLPLKSMKVEAVAEAASKLTGEQFGDFVFGMVAQAIEMIGSDLERKLVGCTCGNCASDEDQRGQPTHLPPGATLQ